VKFPRPTRHSLHWVMDMVFRDDECRVRTDNAPVSPSRVLTPVRFVGCRVPREAVAPLVGRIDDTSLRLVPPRSEALTHRTWQGRPSLVANDPNVWSGRALQEVFVELSVCGLASMYQASDWSFCSGPSWISARVRSH
jgi:hypothetical protein